MGIPSVDEKTLVFQVVDGCMCCGCLKNVRKILQQILGTFSTNYNEGDMKLTIQGTDLDSNILITALGNIKKNVQLITEDNGTIDRIEEKQILVHEIDDISVVVDNSTLNQIKEKQIVVHEMEVFNDKANGEVVDKWKFLTTKLDHKHDLELQEYEKRFTCNGCKEEGFGTRYRCKSCDYELHEDCMNPKPTISHDLFEGSIFKFSHEKPTCSSFCRFHTKSCEACGNEIHGYSYHCEDMNLYLHPRCVNFTKKLCIHGKTFVLKKKATKKCFWCNGSEIETNSGWSYVSDGDKGQLHVNCMSKIAHEAWKERVIGGGDDVYISVLAKRLNWGIVKNTKRNAWSRGRKLLKMIIVFARTVIGILLGDPTVILASMIVEVLKK